MDKVNNINFTGIRNIGTIKFSREKVNCHSLSMILNDDFNGKDLTEFRDALKKIDISRRLAFLNDDTLSAVNIECLETFDNQRYIALNGSPLHCDKDIPLFSYLAKLTRKITKMPEKDMVVNNDYKYFEAKDKLISDFEIEDYENLAASGAAESIFNRQAVKRGASMVNSKIQDIMNHYLGIK